MKITLEIEDKKVPAFMEVMRGLKYVKTKTLKQLKKEEVLQGLKESIEEVKLHKQGKIKMKTAKELLSEL